MELFEGMLQKDKDMFRRVCSKIMSICYICKQNPDTREDYRFIIKNKVVFERYLDILGFELKINENNGVINLVNREHYNHINLKLYESIILLILRILYEEQKRELSVSDVVINTGDIQEKYLVLKIREKPIDKVTLNNTLRLFRRYNLVALLDKDLTQDDARIVIYNSILDAVNVENIQKVYDLISQYRKDDKDENIEEDASDQLAQVS